MKNIYWLSALFILILGCQTHPKTPGEKQADADGTAFMYFKEEEYDVGKIVQGEKVAHIFTVENRGKANLLILSVSASCGCTVAKWDKKPIAPGKTGNIEVVFDSNGKFGTQRKTITVESNAKPDSKILTLKCEVILPKSI